MCGIFGFSATKKSRIKKDKLEEITTTLFKLSETRGKDASGIAIQNSKKISVFKGPYSASRLIDSKSYIKFLDHEFDEVFNREQILKDQISIMGQSRMETNGSFLSNSNNQPVIKDNIVSIHNGIVVNPDNLWREYKNLNRKYEVDTEIINSLFRNFLNETQDLKSSIKKLLEEIEGSASLGFFFNDYNYLVLTTNTGSLYYLNNRQDNYFIFASERYILNSLIDKEKLSNIKTSSQIKQLKPNECLIVNLATLENQKFSIEDKDSDIKFEKLNNPKKIIDLSLPIKPANNFNQQDNFQETKNEIENYYKKNLPAIKNLKRCKKCVLPETMPFISFDKHGVCNYCQNYEKKKILGAKNLEKLVAKYKKTGNLQNCIVCLSGGRDSSYTLHYVKKVLGLNPIAYSYDWGMLTDLGRRNQARMCAELGVEHILVAADIQKKREYIKLNVNAWLKKPELGMIPLFMAGDKQYFYYVNQIKKNNNIKLVIMGENHLEQTYFKNGFAGVRQKGSMAYHVPLLEKIRLLFYYFIQYLKNPGYLNASFLDSLSAFFSYFLIPHDYLNIYDYIKWDEDLINRILIKKYNWETAKESKSTWRIGDGTAAFYNYIYYTVAGFSEFDTFRSNQIREGIITREKALELVDEENKPRPESIKWYCDTIKVDIEEAVKTINLITKLYKY